MNVILICCFSRTTRNAIIFYVSIPYSVCFYSDCIFLDRLYLVYFNSNASMAVGAEKVDLVHAHLVKNHTYILF
jgi:hypothetical protein